MGFLRGLLFVGAAAYLTITVVLWWAQERMIFPAPAEIGPAVPVQGFALYPMQMADGVTLNAYRHPANAGEATVLMFHGNGATAARMIGHGRDLAAAGYGVLLAEYRGYGGSGGEPSEAVLVADGLATFDYLVRQGEEEIAVWGHSLGSGVAVQIAAKRPATAVVLEAPFDSVLALSQERFGWLPVGPLLRHPFRSDLAIGDVEAPILILHGDRDRVVPIEAGRRLHAVAPTGTRFEVIEGAGHNNVARSGGMSLALEFLRSIDPEGG
ncbi:MAG: alpha/beta fold hydrolase [Pseudomonadota bacterium]